MQVITNLPHSYSNNSIAFENKNMGNIVEGTVNLDESAYLYMPIVYEKGWHAYVDGQEKAIQKANYGFSAIKLEKGTHSIIFEYKSPIIVIAFAMTCLGWSCVIYLFLFTLKKR